MAKGKKTGGRKAELRTRGFGRNWTRSSATCRTIIPPKPIVDADERDAADQTNDITQHAGQMMRAFRAMMGKENAPPAETVDSYMKWMNVVLRTAAMLLPYQRPTYRSIEVHTDKVDRGARHAIHRRSGRTAGADCGRCNHCTAGCRCAGRRRDAAASIKKFGLLAAGRALPRPPGH
jgi:hypothetical protein